MNLNAKYVDDATRSILSRPDSMGTCLIRDSITIKKYDKRRINTDAESQELTRYLPERKASDGFSRSLEAEDIEMLVNDLKKFQPNDENEYVWIEINSEFLSENHDLLYKENYYGSLILPSEFEKALDEVAEKLSSFVKGKAYTNE